jgi:hypothetical protein
MGLLDDAIREHLELKRRRGADPGEIERAEREALGPVRRMPEPGDPTPYGGPYDEDDEAMLEEELDYAYGEEDAEADHDVEPMPPSHRVAGSAEAAEFFSRPPHDPADIPGHETAEYPIEHEHLEHDLFDDEPFTDEHEAVEHRPARGSNEEQGEDVLEETPEFLQDTPDHDRLWFEQRPPRDFKFDS